MSINLSLQSELPWLSASHVMDNIPAPLNSYHMIPPKFYVCQSECLPSAKVPGQHLFNISYTLPQCLFNNMILKLLLILPPPPPVDLPLLVLLFLLFHSSSFFFFLFLFFFFLVFRERVSLYSTCCPGTNYLEQAGQDQRN